MGNAPRQSTQLKKRGNARIVSFDDAKRTSARKSAPASATKALTQPLAGQASAAARRPSSSKPLPSGPTSRKPAPKKAVPKRQPKPKAPGSGATKGGIAKRIPGLAPSRKEITIARGAEREGALSMRTEEEIEAQARAEEESRKQDKRKNSRVHAFSDKMRKNRDAKKRARSKAKAEKKFNAAYGGDASSASGAQQAPSDAAGPRAAVYTGKMGASHKKSTKMQAKAAGAAIKSAASGITLPKANFSRMPRGLMRALTSVAIVALFTFALYGPAQQYYQQMRETDRLQAEYAAVAARSNTLQSTIDSLSSDEGIEDKAHTDLGYIKKGEHTATVKGANIIDTTEFSSNVAPGSVAAPETWYSPVLDVVFGYSS